MQDPKSNPTELVTYTGVVGDSIVARKPYSLRWVHVKYTSQAGGGNRNLLFTLYAADGTEVYDIRSGANQAASSVRHYNFIRGINRETAFSGGSTELAIPLADIQFEPGMYMVVSDENGVDAADAVTVTFQGNV